MTSKDYLPKFVRVNNQKRAIDKSYICRIVKLIVN